MFIRQFDHQLENTPRYLFYQASWTKGWLWTYEQIFGNLRAVEDTLGPSSANTIDGWSDGFTDKLTDRQTWPSITATRKQPEDRSKKSINHAVE